MISAIPPYDAGVYLGILACLDAYIFMPDEQNTWLWPGQYYGIDRRFVDAREGASPLPRPKIICQGTITSRNISRVGRMRGTMFFFLSKFYFLCVKPGGVASQMERL